MVSEGDEIVIDTASKECQAHFDATPFQSDLASQLSTHDREVVGEGWKKFRAEEIQYVKIDSPEHFAQLQEDRTIHTLDTINGWRSAKEEIFGNHVNAGDWVQYRTLAEEDVL